MARGADDCGWRKYPPSQPGVFRYSCDDPDYYDCADIFESVASSRQKEIEEEFHRHLVSLFKFGVATIPVGPEGVDFGHLK